MNNANAQNDTPAKATTDTKATDDPYLWLEDIHGTRSMDWVKAAKRGNDEAIHRQRRVHQNPRPHPRSTRFGCAHSRRRPHGRLPLQLLARQGTSARHLAAYHAGRVPQGRAAVGALLDIDALNKAEDKRWVFKGVQCLKPKYERCLVSLSPRWRRRGDRARVRHPQPSPSSRTASTLPVAKTEAELDRRRHHLRRHRFRPGHDDRVELSAHRQGMEARHAAVAASTVYEGKPTDLAVGASHDRTPGYERDFVSVANDFFHSETVPAQRRQADPLDVPTDASADAHREWLLVQTAHRLDRRRQRPTLRARCWRRSSMTSWPASASSRCCSSRMHTRRWPPTPGPGIT